MGDLDLFKSNGPEYSDIQCPKCNIYIGIDVPIWTQSGQHRVKCPECGHAMNVDMYCEYRFEVLDED
jgi:Zn ribbon nucleic-acid-binding protein